MGRQGRECENTLAAMPHRAFGESLCELGGWKNAQTVLRCYQKADEGQLRKALESRRRVRI